MKACFLIVFGLLLIAIFTGCSKEATSSSSSVKNGSLTRFISVDNYLYVLNNSSLHTYDISNPLDIKLIHNMYIENGLETIYYLKNSLFIGSQGGLKIIDISLRDNPRILSESQEIRRCDPVVVRDTIAFSTRKGGDRCGTSSSVMIVYSVKDLTKPVRLQTIEMKSPNGLDYKENILYVCDENKILVYDYTNPRSLVLVTTREINGISQFNDLIVYDNNLIAYTNQGIALFDLIDIKNPKYLSSI